MYNIRSTIITTCKKNMHIMLLLLMLGLVSFFIRHKLYPILAADVVTVLAASSDSANYLRLFDLSVRSFPAIPSAFDFYSNYPWGLKALLPPVWPYMLAAISLPVSAVINAEPARVAGFITLSMAMAVAIPVYFFAKEVYDKKVALAASAMSLSLPYFIYLVDTGIDHHVADIFFAPSTFALFLTARRQLLNRETRKALFLACVCGLIIGLTMLISLTTVLVMSLVLLPAFISIFVLKRNEAAATFAVLAVQFGVASAFLGLLVMATPWFSNSFAFTSLSYLHVAGFAGIALFAIAIIALLKTRFEIFTLRLIIAIAALFTISVVLLMPAFRQTLLDGYLRSIGSVPLMKASIEMSPLFARGISMPLEYFSYLFFTVPIIFISSLVIDMRSKKLEFGRLFFYVMTALLGFLVIQAQYYSQYISTFIVIIYGLGISQAVNPIHNKLQVLTNRNLRPGTIVAICATVASLAIMLPLLEARPNRTNPNVLDLANYIKENTSNAGDFYEPAKKPSYAIMSRWGQSFRLQYLAERPTVGTCNNDTSIKGIIATTQFYQTTDEDTAVEFLQKLNAKYVVVGELFEYWKGDILRIGEPSLRPDEIAVPLSQADVNQYRLEETMWRRLYSFANIPEKNEMQSPLHHFRLRFISDRNKNSQAFLLYEVVKGATIQIAAAPNKPIALRTKIYANNGLVIPWTAMGLTNEHGVFSVVVPYATSEESPGIRVEPYRLQMNYSERLVHVSEQAVINGGKIILE